MKYKTTAKAIRENGGKIIAINYCGAQNLLRYEREVAYTCGVYGWNFDVYDVDGVTICTGYRNMPGKHINYDVLSKYETAAEKIVCNCKLSYEEQKKQVKALLREMLTSA